MLLQFSVSNFKAFHGLQTLNLAGSNYDKSLLENCITPNLLGLKRRRWVKGAAIYGANASGKSTLLEALESLASLVRNSAKTTDPEAPITQIVPFALDPSAEQTPTAFAIVFLSQGVRYEYRVAATMKIVCHESLRAYPSGKEQLWFSRDVSQDSRDYTFEPDNPTGLTRDRDVERRTLPNMLYLSKAIAENRKELEPVFRWIVNQLVFLDLSAKAGLGGGFTLKELEDKDSPLRDGILSMLQHADLGVGGAGAVEAVAPTKDVVKILETLSPHFPEEIRKNLLTPRKEPQLFHKAKGGALSPLPWASESAGTHRFFALVGPWLNILRSGQIVCVDELETSMHPLMVRELLRLFFSDKHNPNRAQIVFTTHNPLMLDSNLIRRDQVWFTDKDSEGAAHLYSLLDYQPRQKESLVRGYLSGRYGAVPFVPEGLLGSFPTLTSSVTEEEER